MKLQLIAATLSFSLVACVSTEKTQAEQPLTTPVASVVKTTLSVGHDNNEKITLKQIMADPDWFGRAPTAWYWGDDSNTVFYQQKQLGTPLHDLFEIKLNNEKLATNHASKKVALADYHITKDKNAILNQQNSHEVYSFNGNVFVKTLKDNTVKQLTFTSAQASDAMFLTNGDVAYRVGNTFYAHTINTGKIVELANLKMLDKPKGILEPSTYIAKEQHKLIKYIALQQRNKKLEVQQKQALLSENNTVTMTDFYFGKGNKVSHASLSPAADKLLVSITSDKSSRDKSDIMPNYVTNNGVIAVKKVRSRVANNRQYKESLFIIDLNTAQKTVLSYDSLPGFDDDVLASVKKENYARSGKVYQSTKTPRNIHLLAMKLPVKWSNNGEQVALMLEAWDNKDRWLTTVNFANNRLISQHRLHDNAWINWNFNEFGWLNSSNNQSKQSTQSKKSSQVKQTSLYYLSEQSGYSHLYVKPLKGKASQLTSGKFEVSDVSLSKDQQRFIFKANKKHPGIYEIYQVDLAKNLTALTNLGGMNNYALSPDESKLLIEHSTVTMPPELYVQNLSVNNLTTKNEAKQVTHTVSKQFLAMPWSSPTIVAIPSSNQQEPIYSRVYLPKNYLFENKVPKKQHATATKNRAVMFTHGAGYLQNSHLGWSGYFREFMFHSMLVQQGYVVIDMDYRASSGYGRDWRTSIYRHMGKVEVEDMRDGVNWLVNNANVDSKRIGTYGGSYGGFLTLMSMFTEPDLFASGSAIRLVSDWAYYNHGYTANILNTPEDDPIAYERSSPIYFAEGLQKPLLINAPMVDDNVFFEDTVRLVQRLIELEKQDFETAIYPVEPHGFVQPSSWLNEYRRIFKLFENTL
ncbi:MAG: prolyl oligopeptidase family serine peptidase [Colwellia sp.]